MLLVSVLLTIFSSPVQSSPVQRLLMVSFSGVKVKRSHDYHVDIMKSVTDELGIFNSSYDTSG